MKKRFTDTDKWETTWFTELDQKYKLLWLYILDKCDHVGQWIVNMKLANFHLGENFTLEEIEKLFKGKYVLLDEGEVWLIPDFIVTQYGTKINPRNNALINVIDKLVASGLVEHLPGVTITGYPTKELRTSYEGPSKEVKEKDKDRDKDRVNKKNKENIHPLQSSIELSHPNVAKIENQLNLGQCHLLKKYTDEQIYDALDQLENNPELASNDSVYDSIISIIEERGLAF